MTTLIIIIRILSVLLGLNIFCYIENLLFDEGKRLVKRKSKKADVDYVVLISLYSMISLSYAILQLFLFYNYLNEIDTVTNFLFLGLSRVTLQYISKNRGVEYEEE